MDFGVKKSDIDHIVYSNIKAFAESRGYSLKDESYPMSEDTFITKRDSEGFIVINGNGANFLLIATGSDYNKKDKLIKAISKTGAGKLFIIKPDSMKIRSVNHPDYELINGNTYLIKDFVKDAELKGQSIVRIEEGSEEWFTMENIFVVNGRNLPKIDHASHEIIWKGYKKGDIVHVTMPSLSSNGSHSCYRIVS
jgi:DNA-directed RNA polymerase subunit H (RpoH/RPB5)